MQRPAKDFQLEGLDRLLAGDAGGSVESDAPHIEPSSAGVVEAPTERADPNPTAAKTTKRVDTPRSSKTSKSPKATRNSRTSKAAQADTDADTWRSERVKATWRLSQEVVDRTRARGAVESLEHQVVVEMALRKFLGMAPLTKEQMRDTKRRATWEALKAARVENVA